VAAPKERGKYSAYFAVTYTTAVASGPALGGYLSDYLHWSAIFWLNLPLDIAALIVVSTLLRRLPRYERPHRLDLIGAAHGGAAVALMLALTWGGRRCAWMSPPTCALRGLGDAVGPVRRACDDGGCSFRSRCCATVRCGPASPRSSRSACYCADHRLPLYAQLASVSVSNLATHISCGAATVTPIVAAACWSASPITSACRSSAFCCRSRRWCRWRSHRPAFRRPRRWA
jgi:MFS family permease